MSSTTTTSGLLASIPHPGVPLGFGPNNAVNPQWYIYWQQLASLANNITNTSTTIVNSELAFANGGVPLGTAATLSSGRGVTISVANNIAVITASLAPEIIVSGTGWTGAALTFTTVNDIDFEGNATISSGQNPTVVQYYTNGGSLNAGNTFALANGPTIGNLLVCIITNSAAGGVPSPGAQFTFQAGNGSSYGGAAIYTALYDGTISAVGTVGSVSLQGPSGVWYAEIAGVASLSGHVGNVSIGPELFVSNTLSPSYTNADGAPAMLVSAVFDQGSAATGAVWGTLGSSIWADYSGGTIVGNAFHTAFGAPTQTSAFVVTSNVYNGFQEIASHKGPIGAYGSGSGSGLNANFVQLALLGYPNDIVTVTVPETQYFSNGTLVETDPRAIILGNGLVGASVGSAVSIDSFLIIGSQTVEQTLALGPGISIGGTPTTNLTLSNTGVLTVGSLTGNITLGAGLSESGQTLSNSGVLAVGTAAGSITVGTGLSLTGQTLSNAGVLDLSGINGHITLGTNLSFSGQTLNAAGGGTIIAQVGTTTQSVGTLNAGANISFSGAAPNLTIVASTTASAYITIEQAGTSIGTVGTINFPAISVAGGVATVNLSDQLDAEFSSTQGAVLYRNAASWQALGPGTAGQVLQTGGAGANPSWVAQSGGGGRGLFTLPTMPPLAGFTQVNLTGTASAIENSGKAFTIIDTAPTYKSTPSLNGLYIAVPVATPYRVAIYCLFNNTSESYWGPAFGWTDGTKFQTVGQVGTETWSISQFSNFSTRASYTDNLRNLPISGLSAGCWFGLRDDGTNVWFEISADGAYYQPITSVVKSSGYLGASGYTNIFFGLFNFNETFNPGTNYPLSASFLAYDTNGLSRMVG